MLTAGPGPRLEGNGAGPRYAVDRIAKGGYNLARITRDWAGENDFARRLPPPC